MEKKHECLKEKNQEGQEKEKNDDLKFVLKKQQKKTEATVVAARGSKSNSKAEHNGKKQNHNTHQNPGRHQDKRDRSRRRGNSGNSTARKQQSKSSAGTCPTAAASEAGPQPTPPLGVYYTRRRVGIGSSPERNAVRIFAWAT